MIHIHSSPGLTVQAVDPWCSHNLGGGEVTPLAGAWLGTPSRASWAYGGLQSCETGRLSAHPVLPREQPHCPCWHRECHLPSRAATQCPLPWALGLARLTVPALFLLRQSLSGDPLFLPETRLRVGRAHLPVPHIRPQGPSAPAAWLSCDMDATGGSERPLPAWSCPASYDG